MFERCPVQVTVAIRVEVGVPDGDILVVHTAVAVVVVSVAGLSRIGVDEFVGVVAVAVVVDETVWLGAGRFRFTRAIGVAVDVAVPTCGIAHVGFCVVAVVTSAVVGGTQKGVVVTVADGRLEVVVDERRNGLATAQKQDRVQESMHGLVLWKRILRKERGSDLPLK